MAGYWDYYYTGSILDLGPPYHGDVWLVKTNEFGNMKWRQRYGGSDFDGAYSVVETFDGGYALAGYTYVTFSLGSDGNDDFWFLKTDESGVVPEAAWTILPLLMMATVAIFISKKS